jgi:structural maintenance of chromosome 1
VRRLREGAVLYINISSNFMHIEGAELRRCIEYLKESRHKPMTFLPLDTIKSSAPDERLRAVPGAKLAIDLIDFDRRDEKVMWFVTGDAIVVQTLEDAKRLAFGANPVKSKIVTIDANIISKSGAMTGGDVSHLTNKVQRWQFQEFDKLKEKSEVI